MRARGLKHWHSNLRILIALVAPHAGAWIETLMQGNPVPLPAVAPHAGAWIETG